MSAPRSPWAGDGDESQTDVSEEVNQQKPVGGQTEKGERYRVRSQEGQGGLRDAVKSVRVTRVAADQVEAIARDLDVKPSEVVRQILERVAGEMATRRRPGEIVRDFLNRTMPQE